MNILLLKNTMKRRIAKKASQAKSTTARYLQFLRVAPNGKVTKAVFDSAPDTVIKAMSNAAVNAYRGNMPLNPQAKRVFGQNRKLFDVLTSRQTSLAKKRRALVNQKGGAFPLIPLLIGAVLGTFGSQFLAGRAKDIVG